MSECYKNGLFLMFTCKGKGSKYFFSIITYIVQCPQLHANAYKLKHVQETQQAQVKWTTLCRAAAAARESLYIYVNCKVKVINVKCQLIQLCHIFPQNIIKNYFLYKFFITFYATILRNIQSLFIINFLKTAHNCTNY